MWRWTVRAGLAGLVAFVAASRVLLLAQAPAPIDAALPGESPREETFVRAGQPPLLLTFAVDPDASTAARVPEATRRALELFASWFGPYPDNHLVIVDARRARRGLAPPGAIVVPAPWWPAPRDGSLERTLIAAIARRYWRRADAAPADAVFQEGLALYTAARAINADALDGPPDTRPLYTLRYFGGYVPHTIRSLGLTRASHDPRPRVRRYPELAASGEPAMQAAEALYSLERHLGWPPLQQALASLYTDANGGIDAGRLAAILSEQRGVDYTWYFSEPEVMWSALDYAITVFDTMPSEDAGEWTTTLRAERVGPAVFASRSLPVVIGLADGRDVTDVWDGAEPVFSVTLTSSAPARWAGVDPAATLLIDADRRNNVRVLDPELPDVFTRRLASWLVWLQDAMLTYSMGF